MVPHALRALVVVGGILIASAAPVFATQVLPITLPEIARRSEVVVHATVTDQKVRWSEDGARILTLTTLKVIDPLKGESLPSEVLVYQVGGSLDGVVFKIPGAVSLRKGEEVVFFGARFKTMVVSYGMGLGKYLVDRSGKVAMVRPEFGDVAFVTRDSSGGFLETAAPSQAGMPLAELKRLVRSGGKGGQR